VERLRLAAPDAVGQIGVTVSIGVAWVGQVGLADPGSLLATTDVALYEAKHAGRNRVVEGHPPDAMAHAARPT
jgi:PleD family two-component response regulator